MPRSSGKAGSGGHSKPARRRHEAPSPLTASALISGELRLHLNVGALNLPVLMVHGSEDPIISVSAAHASAVIIEGAQLLLLEGQGHELLDADVPPITEAILMLAARQE